MVCGLTRGPRVGSGYGSALQPTSRHHSKTDLFCAYKTVYPGLGLGARRRHSYIFILCKPLASPRKQHDSTLILFR
jgi:hypothetical protein